MTILRSIERWEQAGNKKAFTSDFLRDASTRPSRVQRERKRERERGGRWR